MFNHFADNKKFTLKGILIGAIITYKDLPNDRLNRFNTFTQTLIIRWHITPTQQALSLISNHLCDDFFTIRANFIIAWQKYHADTIFT
ncbi:hypothetical protein THIOM_003410 [Candidatus Thiomargarita nelsonii]|uniref:Uncharacterized protein n=1 Tax=Candidatus Thiomargarita nelsonii TaxID=1003181 RepID=A0A176RYT3_9GAMM|nr:hypothetical protein THIOM_003410 [Candidatus Thiomargarita nelsonii]